MSPYAKAHMTYAVYKRNGKQLMVSQSRKQKLEILQMPQTSTFQVEHSEFKL
jgi:ribosomal protein L21